MFPTAQQPLSEMTDEGWKAKIGLEEGIKGTYKWFLENEENFKEVKIK